MTDAVRSQLDSIVSRDGLKLPLDEYERLVRLLAETQSDLVEMRAAEFRYVDPNCTSPP